MHIEIDQDKLHRRAFKDSVETKTMMLCANCFLDECYDLGCLGIEGCECRQDHSDHSC